MTPNFSFSDSWLHRPGKREFLSCCTGGNCCHAWINFLPAAGAEWKHWARGEVGGEGWLNGWGRGQMWSPRDYKRDYFPSFKISECKTCWSFSFFHPVSLSSDLEELLEIYLLQVIWKHFLWNVINTTMAAVFSFLGLIACIFLLIFFQILFRLDLCFCCRNRLNLRNGGLGVLL